MVDLEGGQRPGDARQLRPHLGAEHDGVAVDGVVEGEDQRVAGQADGQPADGLLPAPQAGHTLPQVKVHSEEEDTDQEGLHHKEPGE